MSNYKINLELEKLKQLGFDEKLSGVIAYSKNNKIEQTLDILQEIREENEFLQQQINEMGFKPIEPINPQGQFLLKNNIEQLYNEQSSC